LDLSPPVLREHDTELGRPAQVPARVAPLSDDDRRRLREAEEEQALRDLAEAEEMLASDPAVVRWAGWVASPLAGALLLGAAGALGLFLYSQALSILANLATLPEWARYAGYAGLAILAGAVLFAMARLALLYARLQRNRQLRLRGLEELQSRTRLRWLAHAKAAEAKSRLEDYLRSYPIDSEKDRRSLAKVGVTPEAAAELAKVRDELLDPARYTSAGEWFDRFQHGFQGQLDAAADARISYWSNRAMVVTAVSPNGLVDSLSTSYFSFAMIGDLCRVYHLKAGRTGTAVLLARVFFNAYLSGQINDVEKLVEEQYDHVFQQGLHVVGAGVGSNVAGKFLGKVGAKATTGYLNRVLLSRLGKYACRLLRPVTRE
jgi:uncharacterized membrane protein YcjF (UPF0283 family)